MGGDSDGSALLVTKINIYLRIVALNSIRALWARSEPILLEKSYAHEQKLLFH